METSFDVVMFYAVFILFSLLSAFLMLFAILGYIYAHKKKVFGILVLAVLLTLLAAGSLVLNPFLNYWIFMGSNYEAMVTMKRDLEKVDFSDLSTHELIARFGQPNRIRKTDGHERWIYEPGPWYAYMQLDYIVFKVEDGKVDSYTVDYF